MDEAVNGKALDCERDYNAPEPTQNACALEMQMVFKNKVMGHWAGHMLTVERSRKDLYNLVCALCAGPLNP